MTEMSTARNSKSLMTKRIRRILLVCSNYDNFALEEDGRLEEQLASEYAGLNLSNPPMITRAETPSEALALAGEDFDLVIVVYNTGRVDVEDFAARLKAANPVAPVVVLSSYNGEMARRLHRIDRTNIDQVFCLYNSTDLIIAIIKLLEDSLNAEHDILEGGVQAILLVEDSVRYYSSYLSLVYRLMLEQNRESIKDALNETEKVLRKRSRPKLLFATDYGSAVELYRKYGRNLLGVISDIGFVMHKGDDPSTEKPDAGVDLCRLIREENPKMPFLMQSSQDSMREVAQSLHAGFILKRSETLQHDLEEYIGANFGFGDFVVTDPDSGEELARASDLLGVERLLNGIEQRVLDSLLARNYVSKWLLARGIFSIGTRIKAMSLKGNPEASRILAAEIHDFRLKQGLGTVAEYSHGSYNDAIRFARLGDGSMGGKARGLAFLNHLLQEYSLYDKWDGVRVLVPRTLVISTSCFESFVLDNGLQYVINSDVTDSELLSEFVSATLPQDLVTALRNFIRYCRKPLAVRSSSKLEDSYSQPFAGVYSTYMIPRTDNDDQLLRLLSKAIKSVYASVYFAASRSYIKASGNVIAEEEMAIVIQEVCGGYEGKYYFPTLSGVARSVNFYPVGYEKPEDGIVKLAYGLGKAVVDGEQVLRFSPASPHNTLQISTPELAMREAQQVMYALDLQPDRFKTSVDDAVNLARLQISDCKGFKSLRHVASTYDRNDRRLVDNAFAEGPKFITFAQILKYDSFPLADIIKTLLEIARKEMRCEVEMEFAAELSPGEEGRTVFNVLQIRPISDESKATEVDWDKIDVPSPLISSESALGTGFIEGVKDIIYLKQEAFDPLKTVEMAAEMSGFNADMAAESAGYVLIGYGRWGTSVPTLGVPVKWSDISEVKALVECSLPGFQPGQSQGTHFFQNMTSFGVGYMGAESFDSASLDSMPAVREGKYFRRVRFPEPLFICIDGRSSKGIISK